MHLTYLNVCVPSKLSVFWEFEDFACGKAYTVILRLSWEFIFKISRDRKTFTK